MCGSRQCKRGALATLCSNPIPTSLHPFPPSGYVNFYVHGFMDISHSLSLHPSDWGSYFSDFHYLSYYRNRFLTDFLISLDYSYVCVCWAIGSCYAYVCTSICMRERRRQLHVMFMYGSWELRYVFHWVFTHSWPAGPAGDNICQHMLTPAPHNKYQMRKNVNAKIQDRTWGEL